MEGEGENVIYVQVDEHGRVINYTTNMPGGEQVGKNVFKLTNYTLYFNFLP